MVGCRFADRVYGDVQLTPLANELIACAEVHRLDGIRQLGGCSFVYPSATHTRLEHSIGVAHLASLMGHHLREQCGDGRVRARDVECLVVAGLLHDVGHGPFSHLFEEYVRETYDAGWSHEDVGEVIIERILTRLGVPSEDIAFVKLLVTGLPRDAPMPPDVGRDDTVRFLCDVVHNCTSGIDVDKLDYLLRDSLAVFGATHSIDAVRIIRASRVIEGNVLAFDHRVAGSVEQIYELRTRLHRKLYQHRDVLVVEHLIKDALRDRGVRVGDVDALLGLTDATVLGWLTDTQRRRLYSNPRMTRIPLYDGVIDVRPRCAACGSYTGADASFCDTCGASTANRAFSWFTLPDGVRVRASPAACASASDICRRANAATSREDIHVFISDVRSGVPCASRNGWLVHRVLDAVTFCDAAGHRVILKDASPACHQRFLYCFVDAHDRHRTVDDAMLVTVLTDAVKQL